MRIGRKVFTNAIKALDLLLMMVSFAVATLPQFARVGRFTLAEFFEYRIKLGNLVLFLSFLIIWHILFSVFGLYGSKRLSSRRAELWDITRATIIGTFVIAAFGVAFRIWVVNRIFLAVFWLMSTSLIVISRFAIRGVLAYARRHGRDLRNMLVIGTNPRALKFVDRISSRPELGYRILGFADEDWSGIEEAKQRGLPMVTDLDNLPAYMRRNVVDEVVLALPIRSFHTYASQIAAACEQQGIIVRFLPNIFDLKESRHRAEEFDGDAIISHETTITDVWGLAIKRVIDVVVSLTAIIILSPVMLLAALFVKLTSPGPIFFVQKRLGLNKRVFNIFKFRTMVIDAEARLKDLEHLNEADGAVFKIKKDPRITLVGSFLRKTSIDELPQLFNVLKGEMSLVGPRPLQVRDYELFETHCGDWQRKRFSVRPGITCLWQVMGRSSTTFDKWMELDLQYIRTWSLWLDLEILAKTVPAVLRGSGAA
ncbi:MAG TPA: sugar transferase [Candidatus Sulfotelmatobacter sp.]|nr:sugar transferase [Candidatus Sulfotelmatobacter sp.]